jgi:Na+/melibiose symporter-like transporter
VYTGVWTAGETLGLALGPAVFALALALGDYRSSTTGDVAQPGTAHVAIVIGFSVVPAALTLLSLVWLTRYTLDATEVDLAADGAVPGTGRATIEETA